MMLSNNTDIPMLICFQRRRYLHFIWIHLPPSCLLRITATNPGYRVRDFSAQGRRYIMIVDKVLAFSESLCSQKVQSSSFARNKVVEVTTPGPSISPVYQEKICLRLVWYPVSVMNTVADSLLRARGVSTTCLRSASIRAVFLAV
jgi:hypothetical protein